MVDTKLQAAAIELAHEMTAAHLMDLMFLAQEATHELNEEELIIVQMVALIQDHSAFLSDMCAMKGINPEGLSGLEMACVVAGRE